MNFFIIYIMIFAYNGLFAMEEPIDSAELQEYRIKQKAYLEKRAENKFIKQCVIYLDDSTTQKAFAKTTDSVTFANQRTPAEFRSAIAIAFYDKYPIYAYKYGINFKFVFCKNLSVEVKENAIKIEEFNKTYANMNLLEHCAKGARYALPLEDILDNQSCPITSLLLLAGIANETITQEKFNANSSLHYFMRYFKPFVQKLLAEEPNSVSLEKIVNENQKE